MIYGLAPQIWIAAPGAHRPHRGFGGTYTAGPASHMCGDGPCDCALDHSEVRVVVECPLTGLQVGERLAWYAARRPRGEQLELLGEVG